MSTLPAGVCCTDRNLSENKSRQPSSSAATGLADWFGCEVGDLGLRFRIQNAVADLGVRLGPARFT